MFRSICNRAIKSYYKMRVALKLTSREEFDRRYNFRTKGFELGPPIKPLGFCSSSKPARILIASTEFMGDLIVSLPVQRYILDHDPSAKIFWFVRPEMAPILEHLPGVSGVFLCQPYRWLSYERIFDHIKPDVLLNLGFTDPMVIRAGKKAGIPVRVAAPINPVFSRKNIIKNLRQYFFDATHFVWVHRRKFTKHESQLRLLLLKKLGLQVPESIPDAVSPFLTPEEAEQGKADLKKIPSPRLGLILRGIAGGSPSLLWWEDLLEASRAAGWSPVVLSPAEESDLPQTNLRGLMARLAACDAVVGTSTGPTHLAAVMDVPTVCLMGHRRSSGPNRWAPLGRFVETLQYPGESGARIRKGDFRGGFDRLPIDTVLALLEKLRLAKQRDQQPLSTPL
jgi:ADP-heptose:LPS heptosyltransferase